MYKQSPFSYLSDLHSHEKNFSLFNPRINFSPETLRFLVKENFHFPSWLSNGIHYNKLAFEKEISLLLEKSVDDKEHRHGVIVFSRKSQQRIVEVVKAALMFCLFPEEVYKDFGKEKSAENKQGKILEIDCGNESYASFIVGLELQKFLGLKKIKVTRKDHLVYIELLKVSTGFIDDFLSSHLFNQGQPSLSSISNNNNKNETNLNNLNELNLSQSLNDLITNPTPNTICRVFGRRSVIS